MVVGQGNLFSATEQEYLMDADDEERRKLWSQWYTPTDLAGRIVEWSLRPFLTVDPKQWGQAPVFLTILEPSAGRGALIHRIPCRHSITAFEIDPKNADFLRSSYPTVDVQLADFLAVESPGQFDLAIMNPPYENEQELDFARRIVLDGIADRAVMLMRSGFRHGKRRWELFWKYVDLKRQVDLMTRPKFGGSGVALSDFAVFDITRRDTPLELGEVQMVEVERWMV